MNHRDTRAYDLPPDPSPGQVRGRLAPTPSGFLHAGNAFSFLLTWLLVRRQQGTLHLRIDDLDDARVRPAYVADIFDTLAWMGLSYDTGPRSPEDLSRHDSQQHRLPLYEDLLNQLRKAGVLYACRCSRTEIQTASPHGIYPGTCRGKGLDLDTPGLAWRLSVPTGTRVTIRDLSGQTSLVALDEVMGDFVVRRRDGVPAYQIASLADDLHYGTNLVVRGTDLLPSSAAQLFLAGHLSARAFSETRFYHHPLLTDADGQKLSKSAGSTALRGLRLQGQTPAGLYQSFASGLGIPPAGIRSAEDLLASFKPVN